MLKRLGRILGLCLMALGFFFHWGHTQASYDSEKLALEITMQQRVEAALSKILQEGQYVVVVQVIPINQVPVEGAAATAKAKRDKLYFLPGVPARQELTDTADIVKDLASSLKPNEKIFMRFVERIEATLVLDQSLSAKLVQDVRELTRQILGLDPQRGDILNVQQTALNKAPPKAVETPMSKFQNSLKNYWLIIGLSLALFCIFVFFLFVFGPLRGFLQQFVQVLPMLKPVEPPSNSSRVSRMSSLESQVLPALMSQVFSGYTGGGGGGGGGAPGNSNFSGSLMVENPNKRSTPFSFIREDHLSNLATLLSRENPEKAAVVLGYLPPEWISRVISKVEPAMQSEITEHLATTRQLLPEQVEDIEQDLKRRLDYLIGGPDRIVAVYESLDSENQRKMLDNLKAVQPDLAEQLRQRTFLFEDLVRLNETALKVVLREVELETLVLSLRPMPPDFNEKVMQVLPEGKAEIVKEELEMSDVGVGKINYEAQKKVAFMVRRLEREGHIQLPKQDEETPNTRYGASIQTVLDLPADLKQEPDSSDESDSVDSSQPDPQRGIENKIREFMNRRPGDQERFPLAGNDKE